MSDDQSRPPENPVERYILQYGNAAGWGALLELELRLLAAVTPGLEQHVHARFLEDVEEGICIAHAVRLTEAEIDFLKRVRQLRNKILHCEFRVARALIDDFRGEARVGRVVELNLETKTSAKVLEASGPEASIFGWLLELGASGDFADAASAFHKARVLVQRLVRQVGEGAAVAAVRPLTDSEVRHGRANNSRAGRNTKNERASRARRSSR